MNRKDFSEEEMHLFNMMMDGKEGFYRHGRLYSRRGTDRNPGDRNDFAYGCIGDNRKIKLPGCHYTDDRYKHAQTVFGRRVEGLDLCYDYSDRFSGWDHTKWRQGHENASALVDRGEVDWATGSVCYYEHVLSHFHENVYSQQIDLGDMTTVTQRVTVRIEHVLIGFNLGNGYSYQVYGYHFPDGKPWERDKGEEETED